MRTQRIEKSPARKEENPPDIEYVEDAARIVEKMKELGGRYGIPK